MLTVSLALGPILAVAVSRRSSFGLIVTVAVSQEVQRSPWIRGCLGAVGLVGYRV